MMPVSHSTKFEQARSGGAQRQPDGQFAFAARESHQKQVRQVCAGYQQVPVLPRPIGQCNAGL